MEDSTGRGADVGNALLDHDCCRWKLALRDESDPEYVPVDFMTTTNT